MRAHNTAFTGDLVIRLTGVGGGSPQILRFAAHRFPWSREVLPTQNMFVNPGEDQVDHKPVQRRAACIELLCFLW